MNPTQSNITEDLGYSPISPDVIDKSSESGEEFVVEPGNIAQLNERFRINTMGSNIMAAFVGSATAALFPPSNSVDRQGTIDIAGTTIEREIMELIEESPLSPSSSSLSFIDSEFEEVDMSPRDSTGASERHLNNYGRPVAAILPTPRIPRQQSNEMIRPIPTYPLNFSQESSNFQQINTTNDQGITNPSAYEAGGTHSQNAFVSTEPQYPAVGDITPMVIHLPPRSMVDVSVNFIGPSQQVTQFGFPFNILHCPNVPAMVANEGQIFRLFPTVMPNVSGYCHWCGRTFDQIALETLGDYLGATAYDGETVRDRGVRSRAFIDGFEAALFIFKNAGLSQPQRCDGSGVHQ